ncbi:MAG: transglutaminase family protein [Opitutales bacterium]|nr:transglutaminase family protein [Opitutales bacterium]
MRFLVRHTTRYRYIQPASESVGELRLLPRDRPTQRVHRRELRLKPSVPLLPYTDFFGNGVEAFSVYFRHDAFSVELELDVETFAEPDLTEHALITVGEARQIANSRALELYPYLQASHHVPFEPVLRELRREFFRLDAPVGEAVVGLNTWIFKNFKYSPGATEISTPIREVWAKRAGVCQDFAHVMLAVCRSAGVPARYVSGYIEPTDPDKEGEDLVGAVATHAWVEVGLPGGVWLGLDPTNNQFAGERHIVLAVGRDYTDVAPVRGSFRGLRHQKLDVAVEVKRMSR